MNPGIISAEVKYSNRWPWGQDGTIKVVSYPAVEDILPGLLIQVTAGGCRVARDMTGLIGVSVYDPDRHDPDVPYAFEEMVPILRRGDVWVAFASLAAALPCDRARWNGETFTADSVGVAVSYTSWIDGITDGLATRISVNLG